MPTFREFMRVADLTIKDKTSGKRMGEIRAILKKHDAFHHLTPEKAVAILEDLGPTYVKMGQIASNRSDVLPKEYCDAFEKLRANVPPVPFDQVIATIERSYGASWSQVFASIEERPLGSASIAQVHKATFARRHVGGGEGAAARHRAADGRGHPAHETPAGVGRILHVAARGHHAHVGRPGGRAGAHHGRRAGLHGGAGEPCAVLRRGAGPAGSDEPRSLSPPHHRGRAGHGIRHRRARERQGAPDGIGRGPVPRWGSAWRKAT